MNTFLSFVHKEFIHIGRDPRSLLILLVMPLIMVLILGFIIKNEVTDIRFAVLAPEHGALYMQQTQRLAENAYFDFKGEIGSEDEAAELFRTAAIDVVVVFNEKDRTVQVLADGSEPNQAAVRTAYVQQVLGTQLANQLNQQPINVVQRLLYNPQQRSEVNFVPGVVGLIVLMICCMMTSIAIVREREMGTMEVLLCSPLPPIYIVLAKLVPYFFISLLNIASILCLTVFLMNITLAGSLLLYLLLAMLYVFVSLMLGIVISTFVNTQLAAMLLSLLTIVPAMYLSGMIFSIESMPLPAQMVSRIVPTRWFIEASRKVMIEGLGPAYVVKEMAILLGEGAVLLLIAWKCFKTRLE